MYKFVCLIIFILLCNCSSVSMRDSYQANEVIFNSLIKDEVDLLGEKYASNELLCFFALSPNYLINLILHKDFTVDELIKLCNLNLKE